MSSLEISPDIETVWNEFLGLIKSQINSQSFKSWFEPIHPVRLEGNLLTVDVPSQFFYEWLEEHFALLISSSLKKTLGAEARLIYNIAPLDDHAASSPFIIPQTESSAKTESVKYIKSFSQETVQPLTYDGTNLNPRYTFNNFIKGESNQLARAAAMAVANNPGGTSFNPLVLYGGTGLGKTHLMQAIGNYAIEIGKAKRVIYVTSEKFTIEFIDAIRADKANDFSAFYRSMDILIVDDIQFLSGKPGTIESFFHTFNSLHQAGKQIILSSDRPPKELQGIDDRLISRFQWGLTADIQAPDLETRTAILRKKCEDENVVIPDQVIDFIAANVTSNVRELEGAFIKLLFNASMLNREVDVSLAKEVLKELVTEIRSPVTIEEIQRLVAEFFDIPPDLLRAKTRKQEIVNARQIAMYLAKDLTNSSLKTIGLNFGGRDHSTVIHACQTVEEQISVDAKFKSTIESISKKIEIYSR
ncbi:MAG: chromosomal replication initiator protein DnaA [Bacteroidetes bacterium]|nr:chromosomal replication initiator protein DnaA [Bacteroidota bacterium]